MKTSLYDRHFVYIIYLLQRISYFSTIVFKRSKLKELSTEELIEKLLCFENLNNLTTRINDPNQWSDKENEQLHFKLWSYFFRVVDFQNLQFIIPQKKLLIWSDHHWIMLNIWDEKWLRSPQFCWSIKSWVRRISLQSAILYRKWS